MCSQPVLIFPSSALPEMSVLMPSPHSYSHLFIHPYVHLFFCFSIWRIHGYLFPSLRSCVPSALVCSYKHISYMIMYNTVIVQ